MRAEIVEITGVIRRADGTSEPLRLGIPARLDGEDRIELTVLNGKYKTVYVGLVMVTADGISNVGDVLAIPEGGTETRIVAATELPDRRGSLELVGTTRDGAIEIAVERAEDLVTLRASPAVEMLHLVPEPVPSVDDEEARNQSAPIRHAHSIPDPRWSSPGHGFRAPPSIFDDVGRWRKSFGRGGAAAKARELSVATDDATREVYGRLDAPNAVTSGTRFIVTAGIQEGPQAGVDGDPFTLPQKPARLEIQLLAFGFELDAGQNWRRELQITEATQWPAVDWRLTATLEGTSPEVRSLEVKYALDGQVLGFAKRSVGVVPAGDRAGAVEVPLPENHPFIPPTAADKADLTITIADPDDTPSGRFLVSLDSPHAIDAPDQAIEIFVGDSAHDFARRLVEAVELKEGREELGHQLRGTARRISEQLPEEVWRAVGKLAGTEHAFPSVLLLTAEPHIPWELAYMTEPLDADRPPFLGAQTTLGRWPIVSSKPPPERRPPTVAPIQTFAVVSGEYTGRWKPLVHAQKEAKELKQGFAAEHVDASITAIIALLDRRPSPSLLHFAMHGKGDPTGYEEGLITIEERSVTPDIVKGAEGTGKPFVFLNACQVGQGGRQLGDYSGLAAAFLERGAVGVVAPLWKIDDEEASTIALRFYRRVLVDGEHPAAALRDERASWSNAPSKSTFLAYQFWGHPSLLLQREEGDS